MYRLPITGFPNVRRERGNEKNMPRRQPSLLAWIKSLLLLQPCPGGGGAAKKRDPPNFPFLAPCMDSPGGGGGLRFRCT